MQPWQILLLIASLLFIFWLLVPSKAWSAEACNGAYLHDGMLVSGLTARWSEGASHEVIKIEANGRLTYDRYAGVSPNPFRRSPQDLHFTGELDGAELLIVCAILTDAAFNEMAPEISPGENPFLIDAAGLYTNVIMNGRAGANNWPPAVTNSLGKVVIGLKELLKLKGVVF